MSVAIKKLSDRGQTEIQKFFEEYDYFTLKTTLPSEVVQKFGEGFFEGIEFEVPEKFFFRHKKLDQTLFGALEFRSRRIPSHTFLFDFSTHGYDLETKSQGRIPIRRYGQVRTGRHFTMIMNGEAYVFSGGSDTPITS